MGSPETPRIPGRVEVITDLRALRRALEGGIAIDRIVCPAGKPYLPALYQLVRRYHLRVQQVPPSALPKGATWGAAYVSPVPFRSVEELLAGPVEGLLVALVGITDVRNVGAIVRSAAAFSARGIIWPAEKTTSPANPELWRSSAGALSHLPLFRSHRPYTDLQKLSSAGWPLIATTKPSPQATALSAWRWPPAAILLLGREDKGLPPEYLALASTHLTIPHTPAVESLNVSTAAAILLWHYYQQQ
jgi:23S rRNA (guanosine2251-2'-O)-methyltransferase